MKRFLTTAAVAALLLAPAVQAQARPIKTAAKAPAKALPSAAIKARQNAMNDFSARMGRLDRLMGVPSPTTVRSRSAEAGR